MATHQSLQQPQITSPSARPQSAITHFVLLSAAWVCAIFGCLVISPSVGWPWDLGFDNQLIIIGILMALMKTCFDKIFEATSGSQQPSILHQTITTTRRINLCTKDGMGFLLPFLIRLAVWVAPVAFDASTKVAIGGNMSKNTTLDLPDRIYGLFPPTNTTNTTLFTSFGNTPYLLMNATFDFLEASMTDDLFPAENVTRGSPVTYGYNLLLLGNSSAAALDLPQQSYLSAVKARLKADESFIIDADVRGFVTQVNETVEALRGDDAFWDNAIGQNFELGFNGMISFSYFHNEISLGLLPYLPNGDHTMSCSLGWYHNSSTFWTAYYHDTNDLDIRAFRNSTMMFATHRAKCHGRWRVRKDSLQLLDGDCPKTINNTGILPSTIFGNSTYSRLFSPYPIDVLPILVHSLGDFADRRVASPWKVPSYTMAVVASYWARGAFMVTNYANDNITDVIQDTRYTLEAETFQSSIGILHPRSWLYFILVCLPVLATLAFLWRFYRS
ncbi:hypothetical protein LA080_003732 [Diaporthe eres]|nr:hypothetical protein LA080_003732 [Diaporthe eres]